MADASGALVGPVRAANMLVKKQIAPEAYEELMAAETAGKRFNVPALLAEAEKAHLDMAKLMSFELADAVRRGEAASASEQTTATTTNVKYVWSASANRWRQITRAESTVSKTDESVVPMETGFTPPAGSTTLTLTREQSVDTNSGRQAMVQQLSTDGASAHGSIATLRNGQQTLDSMSAQAQAALPLPQAALPQAALPPAQDIQGLHDRYRDEIRDLELCGDPAPKETWALVNADSFALLVQHGLIGPEKADGDSPAAFDLSHLTFEEVPMTATIFGVTFGSRVFSAVDYGSVAGQHQNMCFYLSVMDGDSAEAISLKECLAPVAGRIAQTFGVSDARFQAIGAPADIEVVLAYVQAKRKTVVIASFDTGKALRIGMGSPDTVYLRLSAEHFTRLV